MPITMLTGGAVARVAPDADLHRLADALVEAGVGALIIGDGDRAEAIVSERDLVVALAERRDPGATTAADIAHDTLVWCDAEAPVAALAEQLGIDHWEARATPAVFSGRRVISSPSFMEKVYISLVTTSEVSPRVRLKTSVNSKIGVAISR